MNRSLSVFTIAVLSLFVFYSCSSSGTGPEPDADALTYSVNVSVEPAGAGTVSPSDDGSYEEGEKVQLQAQASEGYRFVGWSGGMESSDNPLDLTVDKAYSLTALFELKTYDLAITTEGEGVVSETVLEQKSKEYDHGTLVELDAAPAEGWEFVEWTGDITGSDNPVQITVEEPKQVTAKFEELPYYRAANGVTVMCPGVAVGKSFLLDGSTYTRRSAEAIKTDPSLAATACTSGITDMSRLFSSATTFNEDISHWDVSSVTDMTMLFFDAESFNQDISSWDVSSVTKMNSVFNSADSFNQDLSGWDVSNATDMSSMFYRATSFNQDISSWDVGSVTNMAYMFYNASSFNQDIGDWDVSNVTVMSYMFDSAASFNQDLSGWCVTNIDSEQTGFSTGAPLTAAHKPVWGTCPE